MFEMNLVTLAAPAMASSRDERATTIGRSGRQRWINVIPARFALNVIFAVPAGALANGVSPYRIRCHSLLLNTPIERKAAPENAVAAAILNRTLSISGAEVGGI